MIRLVTMLLSSFKRRTSRLMKSNLGKRLTTQMMIFRVLRRMNLRIPASSVLQLLKINKSTRKFSRSTKRLWALLPLTMQHLHSGKREKRKIEMPLKIMKAAMTLTQIILRSEKKGPFASTTIETSALLSSKIRAGLTL